MKKYRIHQIKLDLNEGPESIPTKITKKVKGLKVSDIKDFEIVKRSIDGRGGRAGDGRKTKVIKVLSVDFSCEKKLNLPEAPELEYSIPHISENAARREDGDGKEGLSFPEAARPLVIGFGPCGMFAALVLARAGLKPIVLERGCDVDTRIEIVTEFWETGKLDTECNVQFGEGGAGTFSDGKLNTGIKDPRIRFVLETFVKAGADPDILIDGRPHIGTDDLRGIVKNIREEIKSLGGEVRFGVKVSGIKKTEGGGLSVECADAGGLSIECADGKTINTEILNTETVVLAIGHSARDTVRALYAEGVSMEPKSFSMGVRVEHPQELIDKAMYGDEAGNTLLPPAYYKLSTKTSDGRGVYSFCMCPGGTIVNAASQEGGVVTNGMSNHDRDSGFANSGILVDVRPEDYIHDDLLRGACLQEDRGAASSGSSCTDGGVRPEALSGIDFQEKYERLAFEKGGSNYTLPRTTWKNFREEKEDKVAMALPDFVSEGIREAIPIFGKKIEGFDGDETVMVGIESRSSSPVRIKRSPSTLEGLIDDEILSGFYPGGEGAGYAGGITSAACDGIKIAERIIERYLK